MKTKLLQFWLRRLALLVIFVTPAVLPVWSINRVVEVNGDGEISTTDKYAVIDVILREANIPRGDVNGDGNISIADVTALIDYLLTGDASNIVFGNADCDLNGNVSISDVTTLIDYLLKGEWPEDEQDYEYVDLGLPSGTLWATKNVGASKPEDYGDYFAWGETEPKDNYAWSTYKWCNGSNSTMTKYCTDNSYGYNGFTDGKMELDPEDDAACAHYPGGRMPSLEQIQELCDSCTWQWTQRNGVNGQLVTGPNGNTMFLPAAGCWWYDSLNYAGSKCLYWSRSLYSSHPYHACVLYVSSEDCAYWGTASRENGRTVRAVRVAQESFQLSETEVSLEVGESKTVDILNGSGSYSVEGGAGCVTTDVVGNQLILTGVAAGSDNVIVTDAATNATATLAVTVTAVDSIQPVTETFTVNGVSFTMVAVEGGTFTMGATPEQGSNVYSNEKPTHEVTLSDYNIGQTEVTQELWQAVMGSNPSHFCNANGYTENLRRPVERVSWNDCQAFLTQLNQLTGKNFRLPTEAEWEFAARGGNKSKGYMYSGSNDLSTVGWYWSDLPSHTDGTEGYGTQPVATKAPNELGIYDMSGNVWEWCQDWYGNYSGEAQTNPTGPESGSTRVNRGGSWDYIAESCRISRRINDNPSYLNIYNGFRLAMDVDTAPVFKLSETEVNLEVGESKTVDILNGSGSYSVESGGSGEVTEEFVGEQLILTGVEAGNVDVIVTDDATHATATLSVTVTESDTIQPEIEHEYVDLGLPSGTLWATCNVGANSPEEYGDYFAWGEVEPKEVYGWTTYKWCNGSDSTLTKYCFHSNYGYNGFVDNKKELDLEDDAAYVNWGEIWRMPTIEQQQELFDNCTSEWIQLNGVNGRLFTGSNGNTLFLPAAGFRWDETFSNAGTYGYYWSRTLSGNPSYACYPLFYSWNVSWNISYRYNGFTVRPVRVSQD